jgi:hypothetical protein
MGLAHPLIARRLLLSQAAGFAQGVCQDLRGAGQRAAANAGRHQDGVGPGQIGDPLRRGEARERQGRCCHKGLFLPPGQSGSLLRPDVHLLASKDRRLSGTSLCTADLISGVLSLDQAAGLLILSSRLSSVLHLVIIDRQSGRSRRGVMRADLVPNLSGAGSQPPSAAQR